MGGGGEREWGCEKENGGARTRMGEREWGYIRAQAIGIAQTIETRPESHPAIFPTRTGF
jgi:hypothetical protein